MINEPTPARPWSGGELVWTEEVAPCLADPMDHPVEGTENSTEFVNAVLWESDTQVP